MTGAIHEDAMPLFDDPFSEETRALRPFLEAGFDVTWAKRMNLHNSVQLFCLLSPNAELSEAYGFRYEVVLVFHPYATLEPRAFQAIERFMNIAPAKGRVDAMFYFLASKDKHCAQVTTAYLLEHREERIAIPIPMWQLQSGLADGWTVRNALQQHYLTLDRFKNTLPLREDTYFFGRQKELGRLLDAARQGENSGLFGLRKTGKTSLLFKLQRALERDDTRRTFYLDAQSTSVRLRHWNELLHYIARGVLKTIGKTTLGSFSESDAADDFAQSIDQFLLATGATSLTLIVDEVEWISPSTARDDHWHMEFASFWHAIRTYQTLTRRLSVVVAGVNPSMVELDSIAGFQNPLFGIVNSAYLAGLSESETSEMIQNIGRVMGLRFASDALTYLYGQYAGHPMLTRLACSFTADIEKGTGKPFPAQVTAEGLKASASLRDRELRFYCGHIVSELAQFYPDEYELLELLATGRDQEFKQRTRFSPAASHLFKYDILTNPTNPRVTYDVLRGYVAEENARREGRVTRFHIVPQEQRAVFVRSRIRSIIEDMRTLEAGARSASYPALFGPNSFPEADKLLAVEPPNDEATLGLALTPFYRSFVESMDIFGKSSNIKDYFWTVIKTFYPVLQEALLRLRVYRHDVQHIELTQQVQGQLDRFLTADLEGEFTHSPERYWVQFQRCLDEMHRALQHEISVVRA